MAAAILASEDTEYHESPGFDPKMVRYKPIRVTKPRHLFTALRVSLFYTAAYHAQADGQSERTNQTAEIWLRHYCALYRAADWPNGLPGLAAAMNSSVSAATQETPHKLLFGMNLRMPWNFIQTALRGQDMSMRQDAAGCLKYAAVKMKEYYDRTHQPKHFAVGDKVLLRFWKGYNIPINDAYTKELGQQYAGCFTVLERIGRLAYRLPLPRLLYPQPFRCG
ncbi:hypothetical protein N7465_009064 [Penicillium sp. CMV-2018d]|nr:hypothetical protein N7465_009064 [Penicillium sp. CMV-2018d]